MRVLALVITSMLNSKHSHTKNQLVEEFQSQYSMYTV